MSSLDLSRRGAASSSQWISPATGTAASPRVASGKGCLYAPGGYMATFKYRDDALDDEVVIEEHVLPWTAEHPDWLFVHVRLPVFDRTSCCPSYDPSLTGLGGTKRNYLRHPDGLLDRLVGALY